VKLGGLPSGENINKYIYIYIYEKRRDEESTEN
jgi:hypothetical protein